jgi:galactokinase
MLNKIKELDNLSALNTREFIEMSRVIKDPVIKKRAWHVITENQRVLDAVRALETKNLPDFGRLMIESHRSLRDNFEVTGMELDTLVEEALKIPGVSGSRMTGAGFGGCTVSLVEEKSVDQFMEDVGLNYRSKTGFTADFYIAEAGGGTRYIGGN